jgi:hypothetical protein
MEALRFLFDALFEALLRALNMAWYMLVEGEV